MAQQALKRKGGSFSNHFACTIATAT
jgi:hypothetical protein